jgi:hypothetical protein
MPAAMTLTNPNFFILLFRFFPLRVPAFTAPVCHQERERWDVSFRLNAPFDQE